MDVEKYIASGILELYVAGQLSEEENIEVFRNAKEYPRIQQEILAIESSILALSKTTSPANLSEKRFDALKVKIGQRKDTTVVRIPKEKNNWGAITGWAAAVLLGIGLLWFYYESSELKNEMEVVEKERSVLQQQIFEARNSLEISQQLLGTLRDINVNMTTLDGQDVAPEAYARVYWDKENEQVFVDALGLPEPPEGMVYQVWSLKLEPLTSTSIGLLENFTADSDKVFTLTNINASEAFGITLEPAGGSDFPTLEQLYTLGQVTS